MADFHYQRDTNRFFCLGMDLNRPKDGLKELKFALLKNVRSYQTGRLEPRQGLTQIASLPYAIHSIRRLNTPRTGDWARILGAGGTLQHGKTSFTQKDTGYSGHPLAMVPYRPSQSPDPWMYCMDSLRQRKINVTGTLHQVGLPPPTTAPIVARGGEHKKKILDANINSAGWDSMTFKSWPTAFTSDPKITTSISTISYDSGGTGWCSIEPGSMAWLSSGTVVALGGSEDVVVYEITQGGTTSISSIVYNGTHASIVLASDIVGLTTGSLIETNGQITRVNAVVEGPDGSKAVLCDPIDLSWVAGQTLNVKSTFRTYTTGSFASGAGIMANGLTFYFQTQKDDEFPSTTWMHSPKFSPPLDLSTMDDGTATTADSYFSIFIQLSNPQDVVSVRVLIGGLDTNDFDHTFDTNYFTKTFTPDELAAANWYPKIKWGEMLAVGSPSLSAIYYFKIEMTIRSGNTTVDIQFGVPNEAQRGHLAPQQAKTTYSSLCSFGHCFISGGPGPDVGTFGQPYIYRYRARCSTTGVVSNWGPATRQTLNLHGESVVLSIPAKYTAAAEADMIDFQRRGGSIPENWYYLGSVSNSTSPSSFTDKYADDVIIANPSEDQVHYQLWPVIGAPLSGAVTKVAGVFVSGTGFETTWAPQTQISIGGAPYTIYKVHSSSILEILESAGTAGTGTWQVAEPILEAQPLPCYWGPLAETMFGCGDPVNPQRLYWANPGDADSTQLQNWIDITTPSEPLMNGVIYNGRSYAWSSERFFHIIPDKVDELGTVLSWTYVEIPSGKGLWARWAFTNPQSTPGSVLFFLSKDGIYGTDGGTPVDVTSEDMRPLFPNEGNLGVSVNTVPYPLMIPAAHAQFRLSIYDDYLYFEYAGNGSTIPLTVAFTDHLNNWADTMNSPSKQVAVIDSMHFWSDFVVSGTSNVPFNFTSSLNNWSDSLGVTKTP